MNPSAKRFLISGALAAMLGWILLAVSAARG
jgi:hypothetical protein